MAKIWFHASLIALAVALYAASYRDARLVAWLTATPPEKRLLELREEFLVRAEPDARLSSDELRRLRADVTLVDPSYRMPHTHLYPHAEISALYRQMESCAPKADAPIVSEASRKLAAFIEFRCGHAKALPERFFETPPYMHPSGVSYASFQDKELPRELYHLHERSEGALEASLKALAPSQVKAMLDGEELVDGPTKIAFGARARESDSSRPQDYKLFDKSRWLDHLGGNPLADADVAKLTRRSSVLSTASIASLALSLVVMSLQFLLFRREEFRRRLFSLQMISHELRTPVAAMGLDLERFHAKYDELPSEAQVSFLKITGHLSRLKRVLEASQQYLRGHHKLEQEIDDIASAREYMESLADGLPVHLRAPTTDFSFRADRYWLGFCVGNLVANAISHGRAPVTLAWRLDDETVTIMICDEGTLSREELEEAKRPFNKQSRSAGLGLGLPLVYRVVAELGGKIQFDPAPTTFTLRFPRSP